MVHEVQFRTPEPIVRYRFGQETFVGTRSNGRDAPSPAIRGIATEPLRFNASRARAGISIRRFGGARCGHFGDISSAWQPS